MAIPTAFNLGGSSIRVECKFATYVFAISRPLLGFILVCDKVCRPLARNPRGYTFGSVCGYPETNQITTVFHGYHIWVSEVWVPRAPKVLDMCYSGTTQNVYITGSSHATRLQTNLCLIGHTSGPSISRLSHPDATTNNIHLASTLFCMSLISACLVITQSESYPAMHAVQGLQPKAKP